MANLPRIFVQIASYRDPDCQWTVKDLFEKATHPDRIFVGICWQYVKGEDDKCFTQPYPRPKQVRVHEMDAREAKGVCYARSLTQKLWKGEEFTLQIDSHMRFEPGWDETLISMWEQCGNTKAVLTCYPPGFTPPDTFQRDWIFGMAAREFDQHGILLMHGKPGFPANQLPKKPIPGAFLSACMYFGPGRMIKDAPYDPNLYFFGEEISLGVRLWTHGYDFYHPNRIVIFHDWDRSRRRTHFDDHDWLKRNELSFARVRHLLGTEKSDNPAVLKNLSKFGLGKQRTLEEYQAYSGVDFAKKTISPKALSGRYDAGARIFVNIASYRDRDCQWMVKDLFEKATTPDRVHVGICWQFDEQEDQDCFQIVTRPEQVRIFPVDWREAQGEVWARAQAETLWDGEEYSVQLKSGSRLAPGWDDRLSADHAPVKPATRLSAADMEKYMEKNAARVSASGHRPRKVFESRQAIVFDDFLPEQVYQQVYNYALETDYEYINTKGKISRAWHIPDGFPLRSSLNLFYYAPGVEKPQGDYVYPTRTALDGFTDHLLAAQPQVEAITGRQGADWGHVSVTGWLYPPGTGLAMHDDGSGVYSGAYVYFLNPTWRAHWGGLLVMMDEECNRDVHAYRNKNDQMAFYKKQWLHANTLDDLLMEHGFGKCIMPKKNRIVFIANDAYHMVTRVNEAAGDNIRMSLAGFFNRKKPKDNGPNGNY